jgi:predicted regulator of Ras-like GTPase activity (Roadblock/LC7/MglB family)
VPLKLLLKELVESVNGATGALLLASDGEAVAWHAHDSGERLRLRGAYIAVAMQGSRALALQARLNPGCLIVHYDGASFIARAVERDCFLIIELKAAANIGPAVYHIQPMAARIHRELDL